jgi:hypothetical protein
MTLLFDSKIGGSNPPRGTLPYIISVIISVFDTEEPGSIPGRASRIDLYYSGYYSCL